MGMFHDAMRGGGVCVVCRVSCLCEVLRVERLWIVTDGRDTAPRKETTIRHDDDDSRTRVGGWARETRTRHARDGDSNGIPNRVADLTDAHPGAMEILYPGVLDGAARSMPIPSHHSHHIPASHHSIKAPGGGV